MMIYTALGIISVILINYLMLIFLFFRGLKKIKPVNYRTTNNEFVSVVTAMRNEEKNIERLLQSLERQNFPAEQTEIIIGDDASTDGSRKLVDNYRRNSNLRITVVDGGGGKKTTLKKCLEQARGDIILFTDADSVVPGYWISSHFGMLSDGKAVLSSGPVVFSGDGSLWYDMVQLEFISVVASQAGAVGAGRPLMVNGANMGIKKEMIAVAKEVFQSNEPSGDDVFLLAAVKKSKGAGAIAYDLSNVVKTAPPAGVGGFLSQRLRWLSKSGKYSDMMMNYTALSVFLVNFLMVLVFLMGFADIQWFMVYLWILAAKSLADFLLIYRFKKLTGEGHLRVFPVVGILYPFYVVVLTAMSWFSKSYRWKGRSYGS